MLTSIARGLRWSLCALAAVCLVGCPMQYVEDEEPPLSYRQAEDAFRLGDYDRAIRSYRVFVQSDEAEHLVPRAYYRMALSEFKLNDYNECVSVLTEAARRLPDQEWAQMYTLRGDCEEHRGNTVTALVWWERAWSIANGEERSKINSRLEEAIDTQDRNTLVRARSVLTVPTVKAMVEKRIDELDEGAPVGTKRPATIGGAPPPMGGGMAGPLPRIGCLLPLSGANAAYGRRSLNGIRLALGTDGDALIVRDTAGNVATARTAMDELIANRAVIATIGPLRSEEAAALAPRAEQAGFPMVALSQRDGIQGKFVIQTTMTMDRQAAALAEYAVGVLGMRRFGIIHPNDSYGTGLATAFRRQIEQRNGEIIGSLAYPPKATEFGVEVLSMQKWAASGLDAVFLPGYADTAIGLAKALRAARPQLMLLGSNGWHDPPRLMPAAAQLDGLIFVDGFFANSRRGATRAFVESYQAVYASPPEILEAQAYDAAALLLRALKAGVRSRTDVIPEIERLRSYDGATGIIAVGPGGVQRELFVLELTGGTIREATLGGNRAVETTAGAATEAVRGGR